MTKARIHPRIVIATRIQLQAWRAALDAGAQRVGWKLAFGIEEVEALVGSEPVLGHLTSLTLLEPGATFSGAAAARNLIAETELAVEVGPGATVAGLAVALEIVDTGRPPDGLEETLTANVYHRAVAFGPVAKRTTHAGAAARLRVGDEVRELASLTTDPEGVIADASRLVASADEQLEPGDLILAGSACHVPVGPGDDVTAEIDGLGAVAARIGP